MSVPISISHTWLPDRLHIRVPMPNSRLKKDANSTHGKCQTVRAGIKKKSKKPWIATCSAVNANLAYLCTVISNFIKRYECWNNISFQVRALLAGLRDKETWFLKKRPLEGWTIIKKNKNKNKYGGRGSVEVLVLEREDAEKNSGKCKKGGGKCVWSGKEIQKKRGKILEKGEKMKL